MKLLVYIGLVSGVVSDSLFVCPAGKMLITGDASLVGKAASEDNCCATFKPTCRISTTAGAPFDCGTDQVFDDSKGMVATVDKANCCIPKTCRKAEYHKHGDEYEYERFPCPSGKMPNDAKDSSTTVSEAECCKTFVSTCYMRNKYVPEAPYDIHKCAVGFVFNSDNYNKEVTNADADATCCKSFQPTCEWHTGDVFDKTPFDCGALGKAYNALSNNKDSSVTPETTCCKDFVATCAQPVAAEEWPFQCPSGKVANNAAKTSAPSEANCCALPTCHVSVSKTCESVHCDDAAKILNTKYKSKIVDLLDSEGTQKRLCCTTPTQFSGASAISGAVVIALSFASLLLF
jgi:hypothetical protein